MEIGNPFAPTDVSTSFTVIRLPVGTLLCLMTDIDAPESTRNLMGVDSTDPLAYKIEWIGFICWKGLHDSAKLLPS